MIAYSSYNLKLKSEITIFQNQINCQINENEFNFSQNPSVKSGSYGDIRSEVNIEEFNPYVTTIGLYNDLNELILVGKLYKPIPIPKNNDISFIIRYDS
jgi:hypothetical protein